MLAVSQPQAQQLQLLNTFNYPEVESIKYFNAISMRAPAVGYALFVDYFLAWSVASKLYAMTAALYLDIKIVAAKR
jgi:hypothetical protein